MRIETDWQCSPSSIYSKEERTDGPRALLDCFCQSRRGGCRSDGRIPLYRFIGPIYNKKRSWGCFRHSACRAWDFPPRERRRDIETFPLGGVFLSIQRRRGAAQSGSWTKRKDYRGRDDKLPGFGKFHWWKRKISDQRGENVSVHYPWIWIPGDWRIDHQFSSSEDNSADAGLCFREEGMGFRIVSGSGAIRVSVLQLWGCDADRVKK